MDLEPFTFILEQVCQVLLDEAKLLSTDEKNLLGSLLQQLEFAQTFVRDIEREKQRATISHVLETELRHIMLILPQIEDYLDTLQLEDAQENQKQSSSRKIKAFFSCTSNPFVRKHVVINTAVQLIKDLEDTQKRAEPYQGQGNIPQVNRRRRPPTQPNIMNEELIVGLDEDVRILIAKLARKDTSILAIAGMGGSGKTTLTRKLYNHQEVKGQFGSQAWVCVSKDWDTSHLLFQMCVQIHIPLAESETSAAAGSKLREFLQTNSCLVVLDDVWEIAALQELLPLLLSGGGTVLVTTRNEEILHCPEQGGVYIHKARPLTPEQSWDLFSKIVCNEWHGIRSFDEESVFAELGREMLKRCRGLPLAIVALAGLLSTKGSIQEWEAMKENVITRIMTQNKGTLDYGPVKDMLELSYSDLPYYLKPCFLYLGIYPEDEEIYVEDLIHLWIGEGFLRSDMCFEGQTLEELGMDVVDELVHRHMVQVVQRNCKEKEEIQVHDLMLYLCLTKASESGFFDIVYPYVPANMILKSMTRRAIIFANGAMAKIDEPRIRSLICFGGCSVMFRKTMNRLRVLHLVNVELGSSVLQFGSMTLLRYLRIENCSGFKLLPSSMKESRNLLVFIFDGDLDAEEGIPANMVESMKHLRHFSLTVKANPIPKIGLSNLRHLHTLSLPAGDWLTNDLPLDSIHLRVLKVEGINSPEQLKAAYNLVHNMENRFNELLLTLKHGSGLEYDLEKLKLSMNLCLEGKIRGRLLRFPCILKLELDQTQIVHEEGLTKALAQLHQLRYLMLKWGSYLADKLTLAGLPQLQVLYLGNLSNLKEWRIEEGSLPNLKKLEIFDCCELERIPVEISNIRTLKSFVATYISESFRDRLKKEDSCEGGSQGEDFHLIQHIPSTFISTSY